VISADTHIYRREKRKLILGPAGHAQSTWPAGKKHAKTLLTKYVEYGVQGSYIYIYIYII